MKRKLDIKIKLINHGSKRKHTIKYSTKILGKAAGWGGGGERSLSLSSVMIIILDESFVLSFSVYIPNISCRIVNMYLAKTTLPNS